MNQKNDAKISIFFNNLIKFGLFITLVLAFVGCDDYSANKAPEKTTSNPVMTPVKNPPQMATGQQTIAQPAKPPILKGSILSVENASGYSYLQIATPDESDSWIVSMEIQVKKGDEVEYEGGAEVRNFKSKALKREFKKIVFTRVVSINNVPVINQPTYDKSGTGNTASNPHSSGQMSALQPQPYKGIEVEIGVIPKAEGGYTVAELFEKRKSLAGKIVKVRGKAVKYSPNIMGKNWVHLQDGTGSGPTGDLVVTTSEVASQGDMLLVEGKVAVDKTLAADYRYEILIEEAQLTIE